MSDAAAAATPPTVPAAVSAAIARLMMQYVHAIDNDELER